MTGSADHFRTCANKHNLLQLKCHTTEPFSGCSHKKLSSGGAPTPAGTSVFTKHNWDMGMGYLWLNGVGIYHLMGGAFMAYWVGHL